MRHTPGVSQIATRAVIVPLIAFVSFIACESSSAPERQQDFSGSGAAGAPAARPEMSVSKEQALAISGRAMTDAVAVAPPAPPSQAAQPGNNATTMLIRTGDASILVDSLEPAIAQVHRMAAALGGIVGNTSLSSGDYQVRSATLELRIPSARFNDALEGLKPIGKVESVTSNAQDVGEEFFDITARLTNSKRLENRLVELLATRTGKLEDVLAVERELARVREEIERYEGRVRYLQGRVQTSTLTVTVHERAPIVSDTPGQSVIGNAFREAWRNFVRFIAWFIASLGVLLPLAVIAAAIIVPIYRLRRRRASKS